MKRNLYLSVLGVVVGILLPEAVGATEQLPMTGRIEGPRSSNVHSEPVASVDHDSLMSMEFLVGQWYGKNSSIEIEETWSKSHHGGWLGVRKIWRNDDVEYQVFTVSTHKQYVGGIVRKFEEYLIEPTDKISKFSFSIKERIPSNHAFIQFKDGSTLKYDASGDRTVKVSMSDKNVTETVELNKQ